MKEHKTWNDYPSVKILFDRIIKHRKHCDQWKNGKSCFNCHENTLTNIEKELGITL